MFLSCALAGLRASECVNCIMLIKDPRHFKTYYNDRSLDMQMKYCRKISASHLRLCGIESEIVDLLQDRVPKSVFARHYFTPSLEYRDRVLHAR